MNTDNIFVTVVMCVYNTPKEYLHEAVNSILTQTHKNFELIIVDDASTVEGLYDDEIFNDNRVTINFSESNKGVAHARSIALEKAKGKYIAIMDSDDISLPDRLHKQIEFLETHEDVVVCGTWFKQFGDKNNEVKRDFDDNEYYRCCLLFGNAPTMLDPSTMIRKSTLIDNNLLYDPRLRKALDYKLWVQMTKIGRCVNITEILVHYRVHKNQISQILRTKNVSEYDWIVMKEQYDDMGLDVTAEEEKMLKFDFRDPKVNGYEYYLWLRKMLAANEASKMYNPEKLKKRIDEQWESKILNIKNPFTLIGLWLRLPNNEKKNLFRVELNRIKRKIKRDR